MKNGYNFNRCFSYSQKLMTRISPKCVNDVTL